MKARQTQSGNNFGTFTGVFVPSILTILGVVMYLRLGWVLGHVGLGLTILIIVMSEAIVLLTALSLSALATNRGVEGGGAYFIISRSLGVEAGAAMGLPLFLAQALGISFYIAGFSEAFATVFPQYDPRLVGAVTLVALTALAYKSANLALRSQYIVLAIILASLLSFFTGDPSTVEAAPNPESVAKVGFWAVFAVFFPAVTGIEAGLSMSGDLKDPSRSLPRGTLAAIAVGALVYLAIPCFLAMTMTDTGGLVSNAFIMRDSARWASVVVLGVWAAALSSAMGALLGAPRTLQALARDRIVPSVVGRGYGLTSEPRIATIIAFAVALTGILLGDLNLIAPILSMFFLISYGLLNTCCALESLANPPSWRPSFKTHWALSALGAFGCLGAMFMINAGASIIAGLLVAGIFLFMQRRELNANFGDIRSGILTMMIRYALHSLDGRPADARTWQPNLMVFSGSPSTRWHLISIAQSLAMDRGMMTVAAVLPISTPAERERTLAEQIRNYLARRGVRAFARTHVAASIHGGICELIHGYGFGPLRPNTIMLGSSSGDTSESYAEILQEAHRRQINSVIVREPDSSDDEPAERDPGQRIDLWWGGQSDNVNLLLALAVLFQRQPSWRQSRLNFVSIARTEAEAAGLQTKLDRFCQAARIDADVSITIDDRPYLAVIAEQSSEAGFVFMGMRAPGSEESCGEYADYIRNLNAATAGMPPTALVIAAEPVDFHAIFRQ